MRRLELDSVHRHTTVTYLLAAHLLLAVGSLIAAAFMRQPATLVIGSPSLVILLTTLLDPDVGRVSAAMSVDQPRALEGDTVTLTATLQSPKAVAIVDAELHPPTDLGYDGPLRSVISLEPNQPRTVEFDIVVNEWGVVRLGHLTVETRDRFGLLSTLQRFRVVDTLRVHIHEAPARSLMEPNRFRRLVGSHLSAERGGGCEIADIRPYQPGDRLQTINWRISARNDEPWVTLRHPDRSTTVVLVLDAFQVYGHQRGDAFRRSIRATLGLARLHLNAQDPVGLLVVGMGIRWFSPNLGPRHLHGMTDALLDLSTTNWADRGRHRQHVERLVPPDAVVMAVSPLTDRRFSDVLTKLLLRGQSTNVVEPLTNWRNYRAVDQIRSLGPDAFTARIYALQQQLRRRTLSDMGANVVTWEEHQPFESVLLGLRVHQRSRRLVRS